MNRCLTLRCLDDRRVLEISGIHALIASDASGQFGVLPGHAPLLTLLVPGLIVCQLDQQHTYLATAGGPFICRDSLIQIISTRFLQSDLPEALMPELQAMQGEERSERQGRRQQSVDLTRTLMQRLKAWQELR